MSQCGGGSPVSAWVCKARLEGTYNEPVWRGVTCECVGVPRCSHVLELSERVDGDKIG